MLLFLKLFDKYLNELILSLNMLTKWLKNRQKKRTTNHTFSDFDRMRAAEVRSKRSEVNRAKESLEFDRQLMMLEKQRLELERDRLELDELRDEIHGVDDEYDENEAPEDMLLNKLLDVFTQGVQSKQQNQQQGYHPQQFYPQQQQQQQQQPQKVDLSNEDIVNIIQEQHAKELPQLRKLDDGQLGFVVRMRYPNLSEDTISRAISIIKQV